MNVPEKRCCVLCKQAHEGNGPFCEGCWEVIKGAAQTASRRCCCRSHNWPCSFCLDCPVHGVAPPKSPSEIASLRDHVEQLQQQQDEIRVLTHTSTHADDVAAIRALQRDAARLDFLDRQHFTKWLMCLAGTKRGLCFQRSCERKSIARWMRRSDMRRRGLLMQFHGSAVNAAS